MAATWDFWFLVFGGAGCVAFAGALHDQSGLVVIGAVVCAFALFGVYDSVDRNLLWGPDAVPLLLLFAGVCPLISGPVSGGAAYVLIGMGAAAGLLALANWVAEVLPRPSSFRGSR
jgi:hypothetical protein